MAPTFQIQDLRAAPQFAEAIAQASTVEWGDLTGLDLDDMRRLFDPADLSGQLPVTLVASADGRFAGFVSMRHITMGAIKHPEYYLPGVGPWLSNMWIEEWARGRGLASALTQELHSAARRLGYVKVYSSTAEANSLYHKLGYQTLDTRDLGAFTMYLIACNL